MIEELKYNLSIFDYYYYSKKNDCKASGPDDKDCICWHKEGTGPNSHVQRNGDLITSYSQRHGFSTIKLTWKKKLNMVKVNSYIVALFLITLIITHV